MDLGAVVGRIARCLSSRVGRLHKPTVTARQPLPASQQRAIRRPTFGYLKNGNFFFKIFNFLDESGDSKTFSFFLLKTQKYLEIYSVACTQRAILASRVKICLSFSRFALSQPIFMVEVSKCPSQKVKRGLGRAHFDPSSSKSAIGPTSRANQQPDRIPPVQSSRVAGNLPKFF